VAITASAGGIEALGKVLGGLPADFPVAVVVVQHISQQRTSLLARILQRRTALRVKQAESGDALAPGTVFVAPPGVHLLVEPGGYLSLAMTPKVSFVRPSGDVLFGSTAACCKDRAIAVVLTGGGRNGAAGVRLVKELGGFVIAQDEATSYQFAMPRAAIATKCVDLVLPLSEIAPTLVRLVKGGADAAWAANGDGIALTPV
jgi:two-component system chemotaxis response regulator CheB